MNLPITNEQVSAEEGMLRERETSPRQAIKVSNSACKNVTPLSSAERAELLSVGLFVPPPHLWVSAAQPLSWGCHQGDACVGLGMEQGAVLGVYRRAPLWFSHPALLCLPLGTARASAARGSHQLAGKSHPRKRGACSLAPCTQGSPQCPWNVLHSPAPPQPPQQPGHKGAAAGFCHDHVCFGKPLLWKLAKVLRKCSQHCMHRGLRGYPNLLPARLSKCSQPLLPNCSQTKGVQALGDGLQLLQPQPEFGSSALEGTIKKHFALQLKSLIKICKHVNGKGKKGSVQSSPFPLAFLLNFQIIPRAPSRSVGQLGVPPCLVVPGLTPPGPAWLAWLMNPWRACVLLRHPGLLSGRWPSPQGAHSPRQGEGQPLLTSHHPPWGWGSDVSLEHGMDEVGDAAWG